MNKIRKITITLLLILLVILPVAGLLIYPHYNDILLLKNSLNPYNQSKDVSMRVLAFILPNQSTFEERVLGFTSIEESLRDQNVVLENKILEETNSILSIDTLNIEGAILQGESPLRMDDGFWHFPTSSLPGEKGNVVIIGHRFMYLPPNKNTFFNLEDSKVGDEINIKSDTGEYTYIVVEQKIIEPNELSVLEDTDDYRLTLITCTPLWTAEKRLVIVAKLDKLYKKV